MSFRKKFRKFHKFGLMGLDDENSGPDTARLQFATWLKNTNPELFSRAIEYAENWRLQKANEQGDPHTVSGLGVTPEGSTQTQSFWGKFTEGLTQLATGVLAYKTQ